MAAELGVLNVVVLDTRESAADPGAGWRQGFLVIYLAVLPQFLGPDAPPGALLVLALSHAALSLLYLLVVVAGLTRARRVLTRRNVRRTLDAATGTALLGFSARLATE